MDLFWENTNWADSDKHLQMLASAPFRRTFPFIPEKPGLYIFRGPRQVGKSTWLKSILQHHTNLKNSSFYLSCEDVPSYRELSEILSIYKSRKVILLDEISFVNGWDRAVKKFVDSSLDHIVVITGSHSHDLKRGADTMPGRFGAGGEFFLLPMNFEEFSQARKDAGWFTNNRIEELEAFFRVGGFPFAVAEGGSAANIPLNAIETIRRWLFGDCIKLGKQEGHITETIIQIARSMQTPLSFQSLAQKTSFSSHNTAQDYISILESCFAVKSLLAINQDIDQFHYKKGRKFYFTDPILFHLALSLSGDQYNKVHDSKIAELVAHEALSRRFSRFGYLPSKKGEIDFFSPKHWAVEVKWSDTISNISQAYLAATLPWKKIWNKENFLSEYPAKDGF